MVFILYGFSKERQWIDPNYFSKTKHPKGSVRTKLDISSLGKEKIVLFLNVSDNDHSMDAMVNIFYTQALQTLICDADKNENGQLDIPVRIIMDDFASSALIPDFDKLISIVRSRDIWLTRCIQSLSQLETLYSKTQAITILNCCDHVVYLGSNDLDSAQYVGTRALKTPETILSMDRSSEYVLETGKPAVLVKKIPSYSFEDPETKISHGVDDIVTEGCESADVTEELLYV